MTNQLSLFDNKPNPDVEIHDNQHLRRVRGKVADHIRAFAESVGDAVSWHMEDLHRFVLARESVAPASTDRILRAIRTPVHMVAGTRLGASLRGLLFGHGDQRFLSQLS
jgi:hypothetical protein